MVRTIGALKKKVGSRMAGSKKEIFDYRKTLSDDPVLHLSKLGWEIAQIRDAKSVLPAERTFMSINAALTAWHIHEWLWKATTDEGRQELLRLSRAQGTGLKAFVLGVQRSCEAIAICRQFATAQKHFGVEHNREDVYYQMYTRADGPVEGSASMTIYAGGKAFDDVDIYTTALIAWARLYVYVGYPSAKDILSILPDELWPSKKLRDERASLLDTR